MLDGDNTEALAACTIRPFRFAELLDILTTEQEWYGIVGRTKRGSLGISSGFKSHPCHLLHDHRQVT